MGARQPGAAESETGASGLPAWKRAPVIGDGTGDRATPDPPGLCLGGPPGGNRKEKVFNTRHEMSKREEEGLMNICQEQFLHGEKRG